MLRRRDILAAATATTAGLMTKASAETGNQWEKIIAQYDVARDFIQLENGNFGTMARPVFEAYRGHLDHINRYGSYYARRQAGPDLMAVRAKAASVLGVSPTEIVFTRGATESLQTLIAGYDRLKPNDGVLTADLDYDSMQEAFAALVARRGVKLFTTAMPEPATHQGLIDAYEAALKQNPSIRLMLLTHVSHRTGLVMPVKEIVAMARTHGVDVIVDAAHSWGQLDFKIDDLGADFVGFTCHKWIGAPLGVGIAYIRASRLGDIALYPGESGQGIDHRLHTGTTNFAAALAVGAALDLHTSIGASTKESRLRSLRDRWAEALRGHPGLEILTPSDQRLTCGITSFRLNGKTSVEENRAVTADLLKRFNIFTVDRAGPAKGACVRVTPAMFTRESEIDALIAALKQIA
ncbi:selenocysteine lyase/cysteine desulfurase [Rhizomicrobium palustre]|uniref:Selenocysteine lyase/cysteine desulfurase n=1 Tax=Rhizomicrobium palustre TaxID=189966 RepID=A0A846N5V8_9PROT|nr:aminotransferase class V-fold PLP-dependent enzyme [Rhizomicrobium palustre]NIK90417.1 selenocysteine lyase/cysteine desulfurase [Rhizomicrobium palustre]